VKKSSRDGEFPAAASFSIPASPSSAIENFFGSKQGSHLLHWEEDLQHRSFPGARKRREILGGILLGGSTLSTVPSTCSKASAAEVEEEPKRRLDKVEIRSVPVFAVTDASGTSPYFTDETADGKPAGYFFTEKREAERILEGVKKEDPKAKITSVPLPQALAFVNNKGLNLGGEFHILPAVQQLINANNVRRAVQAESFLTFGSKLVSKDAYDRVPCFFEEKLAGVIDGEPTVLAFLKYEDLVKVWTQQTAGLPQTPDFTPQVVDFTDLMKNNEDPDKPNVFVISSEMFDDEDPNAGPGESESSS